MPFMNKELQKTIMIRSKLRIKFCQDKIESNENTDYKQRLDSSNSVHETDIPTWIHTIVLKKNTYIFSYFLLKYFNRKKVYEESI